LTSSSGHTWKNVPHLGKCATLGKMHHNIGKVHKQGKVRQTGKSAAHLEKYGTPGGIRHT